MQHATTAMQITISNMITATTHTAATMGTSGSVTTAPSSISVVGTEVTPNELEPVGVLVFVSVSATVVVSPIFTVELTPIEAVPRPVVAETADEAADGVEKLPVVCTGTLGGIAEDIRRTAGFVKVESFTVLPSRVDAPSMPGSVDVAVGTSVNVKLIPYISKPVEATDKETLGEGPFNTEVGTVVDVELIPYIPIEATVGETLEEGLVNNEVGTLVDVELIPYIPIEATDGETLEEGLVNNEVGTLVDVELIPYIPRSVEATLG